VKLTELHSDEYFPTCLLRQPANPSANAKIISSIIQVSHAHALAACFLSNRRMSSPPQILAHSSEVSMMTFVNPAPAAVELVETTVEVWRVNIVWLCLDSLV
jgi:hypothetical protein